MYIPVTHLSLWITESCNLGCEYCFVKRSDRKMALETGKAAVEFLLRSEVSGAQRNLGITFFGGEPLLEFETIRGISEHWKSLTRTVNKRITFSLITNGTLLTEDMSAYLRERKFRLQYSMDGIDDASWRRCFPNGTSAYEAIRSRIPTARRAVRSLPARMTVTRDGLALRGGAEHLLSLGFDEVAMVPQVEGPWEKSDVHRLRRSFKELADWYIETAREGRILPLITTNIFIHRYHAALGGAPRPENPCGAGRGILGLDTQGNLLPCQHWVHNPRHRLGTVRTGIDWDAKASFERLTSSLFQGCSSCRASHACAGPCRALSEQFGGDMTRPLFGHCLFTQVHVEAAQYIYHALLLDEDEAFDRFLRLSSSLLDRSNLDPNRTRIEERT